MVTTNANPLPKLRVAILLPGLGRVCRGAETAFLEVARGLAKYPDISVSLFGSGPDIPDGLSIENVGCIPREWFVRWPHLPILRNEYCYEELSFILRLNLRRVFHPSAYDVALHCSFPFTNWFLNRMSRLGGPKPVFVTQNGDWMCRAESREYRSFQCAGLICINPEYYDRHKDRYHSSLIPNGVDPSVYRPKMHEADCRVDSRIPRDKKMVLMTSALIPSKRVADGIKAIAKCEDCFLVVAGDGPDRQQLQSLAQELIPNRHLLMGSVPRAEMPDLYRRADAFLHVSRDEPFGIAYLEAMATGLPVVAADTNVTRWIMDDTAIFVDESDLGIANGIKEAIQPEKSIALGMVARDRVIKEWSWDAQIAKYRDFLYSCVPNIKHPELMCSQS